jgi:hypothetical protein
VHRAIPRSARRRAASTRRRRSGVAGRTSDHERDEQHPEHDRRSFGRCRRATRLSAHLVLIGATQRILIIASPVTRGKFPNTGPSEGGLRFLRVSDQLSEFERAVLAQAPRGALVAGAALSPDGRYGAALTVLPTASDYLMDDVLEMTADGWRPTPAAVAAASPGQDLGKTIVSACSVMAAKHPRGRPRHGSASKDLSTGSLYGTATFFRCLGH